ncbi:hypothetical protein [Pseudoduganella armeniaca]|uniref:hypothetical protein n=1 Tax=Pseudoduganella armeniaca TaxID=2072590 RepID=UPI0015E673D0|nr:hypothetical protein [Pseudoduganella armeniaca]
MSPRLFVLTGAVALLSLWHETAGGANDTAARFGAAATDGTMARDGIAARAYALHRAMACGNEFAFARGFALAGRHGKASDAPVPNLAQWPVTLMLGKAALLADRAHRAWDCEALLSGAEVRRDWLPLTQDGVAHPGEMDHEIVNRVFRELYDSAAGASGPACAGVAREKEAENVGLRLSRECLARQIRAIMTHPRHGPWTEEGGVVTPELAGTSAGKLPCLSEFTFKLKGLSGDWDMAVIEYTRLAALLYRFGRSTLPIGEDVTAAIAVLNRRFLTLRSSPEQGATARELFNLVTSCGNLPNQYGDAIDTVNGSGVDPGSYAEAANDALGKKSFWDSLLRFLAALVIIVVFLLAAALAGAIAGAIAGALSGAVGVGVAVAVAVGAVVLVTLAGGGIEETENHLLMQNSSRYVKNKLMMAELSAQDERKGFDTIAALNEELRVWLLMRMQRIARDDFVEYNAKPYNRLSHAAILNLLDYACDVSWDYDSSRFILNGDRECDSKDRPVVDAAAALLDLSAAKLAVGSLEGRRLIPYRRLVEENYVYYRGRSLLELGGGADNQLAALQLWTGQMRHAPDQEAKPFTFGQLAWFSTSQYRPDPLILDIAVNKATGREQQYRHHARERYASGNGWLITAGGSDAGPAQGFRSPLGFTIYPPISGDVVNDRGVGVPTTLMTGAPVLGADGKALDRARVKKFLRFDGKEVDWGLLDEQSGPTGLLTGKPLWSFSDNNCVAGAFACGLRLRLPDDFRPDTCRTRNVARNFFIVDSTRCAAFNDNDGIGANDLFIVIFQSPQGWGFFEVAQQDAYGRSIDALAIELKRENGGRFAAWASAAAGERIDYYAVTQKRLLTFTPADEAFGADRRACGVVNHESGARFTISNVAAAEAAHCRSVGPRIFIDLNDARNPVRRGEGGLILERYPR